MTLPYERQTPSHFDRAIGLWQICGVGPFVTIPIIVSQMGGPQAMFGWIIGAIVAMADGLVWAELGAAMPGAGGTYVYLREAFQYSCGKLMPFLFVWTAMIFIPLTMATGVIGMVQYVHYYFPAMPRWADQVTSIGVVVVVVVALYRNVSAIGKLTSVFCFIMFAAVGGVIVASFTHFHPHQAFTFPAGTFGLHGRFLAGLGAGLATAVYDYLGYNTTAYMAEEIRDPGRVLPRSIIYSIAVMMVIYLVMNVGVLGAVPWQEVENSTSVGSLVFERTWGKTVAQIFTALIIITAFASVFTGILGGSRVPYNAARDKLFLPIFARLHPRYHFPHVALLVMCAIMAVATFFPLDQVIAMLMAVIVLVQSVAQIAALVILRRRQPMLLRPYRMLAYPIPAIIALIGWGYLYYGSGWRIIVASLVWVSLGVGAFLIWAKVEKQWPFALPPGHCKVCGYDLRATPDRCPECGTLTATSQLAN